MALSIITGIVGLIKAIPVFDSWFQQLAALYVQSAIHSMQKENVDALRKAINEKDQRDLEKAIGNPNHGAPSGYGTIRDSIPGVPKSPGSAGSNVAQ